jgi:hypothetical protein
MAKHKAVNDRAAGFLGNGPGGAIRDLKRKGHLLDVAWQVCFPSALGVSHAYADKLFVGDGFHRGWSFRNSSSQAGKLEYRRRRSCN